MYDKTTSVKFEKYGQVFDNSFFNEHNQLNTTKVKINQKKVTELKSYSKDIYLRVVKGIAMIVLQKDEVETFVIHRTIRIKRNTPFNIISMTKDCEVAIQDVTNVRIKVIELAQPVEHNNITSTFKIEEIYACYYQIKQKGYAFDGEQHDYWELTYVDYGQLQTTIDGADFTLNNYDLIFYGPGQFHDQNILNQKGCSYITIMFNMDLKNYMPLLNHIFKCEKDIYDLMNRIVTTIDDRSDYARELLLTQLKSLIIRLLMSFNKKPEHFSASTSMQQHFEDELLNEIVVYLNSKVMEPLNINDICKEFSISRSSLQHLFQKNLNTSPKLYFNNLKLAQSKILIREDRYNISEISEMLGFTSIHYFSRKFKQTYKKTHTEYSKSLYKL